MHIYNTHNNKIRGILFESEQQTFKYGRCVLLLAACKSEEYFHCNVLYDKLMSLRYHLIIFCT